MVATSRFLCLFASANLGYCSRMISESDGSIRVETPDCSDSTESDGSFRTEAPERRNSLTACPCTMWQHCSQLDLLPDCGSPGVACVASPSAIVTMGHQVQCVPARHGGLDYQCPGILSHKCDPAKECVQANLGTCDNFAGCTGSYTRKWNPPEFCALSECTHAECCDPLGWWSSTGASLMPIASSESTTCSHEISVLAERTMERLMAYTQTCGFNAFDIDYDRTPLALTGSGQAKLAVDRCQNQRLLTCGLDNLFEEARRVAGTCREPILEAQLSTVGIFGTTAVLDAVWRAARQAGNKPPDACGAQQASLPIPSSNQEGVSGHDSLTPCPCTIWQHCSHQDLLPEGAPHGVACVASEHSIVTMPHQVQCVPHRHVIQNYYCPSILSHMCKPDLECFHEDLGTCANFHGCNGEYAAKPSPPQYCATSECTHAECCDPLGWWFDTTVTHSTPMSSPEAMTCAERRSRVTEPTMERLITYINACDFNAGDVNYMSAQFQLTESGREKIACEKCQDQQLLTCGVHDIAGQARQVAGTCSNAIFEVQLLPSGIFGTVSALDAIWMATREAGNRPPDACGVQPEELGHLMPEPALPSHLPETLRNVEGANRLEDDEAAERDVLTACPCTIWQHCSRQDLLPEGAPHGVACVASEHAIVTMGHQVQCVPDRHGGVNYQCPSLLSHMCKPDLECFQEDLGTCANFDGCNGEYGPKSSPPQFCAMSECTHAECCNPLGWWFDVIVARTTPIPSYATMSCSERRSRVTEPTMERLLAYTDACGFNAGDVDYTSAQFQLTESGRAKLASESCQNERLLTCGYNDVAEVARRVGRTCGDPFLDVQVLPSGIFGTVSALDAVWRDARDAADRPPDSCGVEMDDWLPLPNMAAATAAQDEYEEEMVGAINRVRSENPCVEPTCPEGRCCACGYMTFRAGSHSKVYQVDFGPEAEERSVPCDIGPYQYGTVELKCMWHGWTVTSNRCRRWFIR